MSYQQITIVGNLGREPEMRYTPSGQAVTNFSVATNRQYNTSNGEKVKETVWFRVSAWGRQAETCNQYLSTGSQVLIEGRLTPDRETGGPRVFTRNDGTTGSSFEITAGRVVFLSGRGDEGGSSGGGGSQGAYQGPPDDFGDSDDDEIPF
jgi:single-strand DNA-binding protein